jgi:hypothetical protein
MHKLWNKDTRAGTIARIVLLPLLVGSLHCSGALRDASFMWGMMAMLGFELIASFVKGIVSGLLRDCAASDTGSDVSKEPQLKIKRDN